MPGLRFYNQRSRHEHSISTPPLESCLPGAVGKPASVQLGSGAKVTFRRPAASNFRQADRAPGERGVAAVPSRISTPDHLAVIRPPAAACLTARPPASVRSTAAWTLVETSGQTLFASRGRKLRGFFGSPEPCRSISSDASLASGRSVAPTSGVTSGRLIRARRGARQCRRRSETEAPSIARDRSGRSCESPSRRAVPAGRPERLPRVFTGVRDTG
jgi:hypothetical protein